MDKISKNNKIKKYISDPYIESNMGNMESLTRAAYKAYSVEYPDSDKCSNDDLEIGRFLPPTENYRLENLDVPVPTDRQRHSEITEEVDSIQKILESKDPDALVKKMRKKQKAAFAKTIAEIKTQIEVEQDEIDSLDQALEDAKKHREKLVAEKKCEYDKIAQDALDRCKADIEREEVEIQEMKDREIPLKEERGEIRDRCRQIQDEIEKLKEEWGKERKRLAQEQRRLDDDEQAIKQREERLENQRREQMRSVASQELELLKKQEALNLFRKDVEEKEVDLSKRKNIVINEEKGKATLGDTGRQLDI